MPHDDVERIFKSENVNLFITTSATEGGVPISLVEAFSMGIPAIGTDVGGIPEAIRDGYNGFFTKKKCCRFGNFSCLDEICPKIARRKSHIFVKCQNYLGTTFYARDKAKEFCRDLQDLFIS